MAFTFSPNALVTYLDAAPWFPGPVAVLVSEIPITQIKDYASFLDPESIAFNKGPMVRWFMDGAKGFEVFGGKVMPRHDAPLPGTFIVTGQGGIILAFECVYAEPIMRLVSGIYQYHYWYLFLRQLRPGSAEPPMMMAPEGGADFDDAAIIQEGNPYFLQLLQDEIETWWKLEGLTMPLSFLGDVYWDASELGIEVNLYYGDPPLVPADSYTAPGPVNSEITDSTAYIQVINNTNYTPVIYWNAYAQDACIAPTTSTTWSGAALLGLSQWYCMTFNPGDAFYFKFPALDGAGFNFTVETIVDGNDPMIQTFAMDNGSPPTNTFWSYNGTGSNNGTTTGAPFGIQITSMATRLVHFRVTSP